MPKLWNDTIDAHRRAVRDATLDTVAELAAAHGLASITMSQIAQQTGIGRATLYKYFPDVEAVLRAWHERQVGRHLALFSGIVEERAEAIVRLEKMLDAYAMIVHQHHGGGLSALLHGSGHVTQARNHLAAFLAATIADGVATSAIRDDVSPQELALFCLSAVGGAADLPSQAAVTRLVQLTLSAIRRTP